MVHSGPMNQHPQTFLTVALCCAALSACATRPRVPEAPIRPPAPVPVAIGAVALVNTEARFVLVRTGELPSPGTHLQTRSRDGAETAQLQVAQEQKAPFVAADIVKGKPQVGEVVTK